MAEKCRHHSKRHKRLLYHHLGNELRCRFVSLSGGTSWGYRTSASAKLTVPTTNPPAISFSSYTNGMFQMQVAGDVGPNYLIQGSTNLTDWESVYTTNPTVMPFLWIDPQHEQLSRASSG